MPDYYRRFIALPTHLFKNENGLEKLIKYRDILTYVTLRSYNNSTDNKCFPAYETLASRSGMSRTFIIQSIKRLHKLGAIDIEPPCEERASNSYYFEECKHFQRIPYEVFSADLTANEKAMLLCIRLISDGIMIIGNPSAISKNLGLSYNTFYPLFKSLKDKGYIEERKRYKKGVEIKSRFKNFNLTDKIDWTYLYNKPGNNREAPSNNLTLRVG